MLIVEWLRREKAMENDNIAGYRHWHELLDAICIRQGHLDNMALAEELCLASGSKSQESFEATLRNLHNWRNGTHVPRRRNFLLLTKVLQIESREDLSAGWNALYQEARKPAETGANDSKIDNGRTQIRQLQLMLAGTVICLIGLAGTLAYLLLSPAPQSTGYPEIEYHRLVTLGVGDSEIIHGRRGACGEMPPAWEVTRKDLPDIDIGSWSDGGIGLRNSRSCGGPTPARALMFTATAPGRTDFDLYSDPITIRVE
ncbi:MAG: hypothetical protein CMJ15_14510 [Pelagibacterium sp.]|nr:hypothetical protein [Pelagibacterium sp.]|tara:strand:+ start:3888 stop:4658 length:771 start_codon:yes stop_codon:yes gene_type:complete